MSGRPSGEQHWPLSSKMPTTDREIRWYHLTPGRIVLLVLAVEVLLWLSERFGWLGWHKGYAVLTGVALVGVAMLLMLVWFGVAVVFRRRFQFSLWSLLVLVVVVAVPCSWLAIEKQRAKGQKDVVDGLSRMGCRVEYWQLNSQGEPERCEKPAETPWLKRLLGDDFFGMVLQANFASSGITDAGLEHLKGLPQLRAINLDDTNITEVGLQYISGLTQLEDLALRQSKVARLGPLRT